MGEPQRTVGGLLMLERLACQRHLSDFIRQAWRIIEPKTIYFPNWHIELLCEYLEAVCAGEIKRLLVNMPPRYMKSSIISVLWPCWWWTHEPASRWIFASYADTLASFHSLQRRRIIENPWYARNWPHAADMVSDQNVKTFFQNRMLGHMIATTMKGAGTGLGGNFIVIDDPHKTKEAEGSAEILSAVESFKTTFATRHDDKKRGATVIVMQRVNQQDLSGYVLEQGGWTHLKLEAECEQRTVITFPRSGKQIVREEGDLLWPKREGPDEIAEHKKRGSYYFASQFQQRPVPLGGGIIKRAWWKRYPVDPMKLEPLTRFSLIVQSWDTAAKTNDWNDYSVCTTWGVTPANQYYLLHRWRQRVEYPDLKRAMRDLAATWKPGSILIEDSSAGQSVVQDLKREHGLPIVAIPVHHDKVANAVAASGMIEAGNVLLPERAEWNIEEYVDLMSRFPNDAYHDDDVDSTTMFINYMREHGFNFQDYWQREVERIEGRALKPCPRCGNPMRPNDPVFASRGTEYCSLICAM